MKPTKERFIEYTIAIVEGKDLSEFSDIVEWLKESLNK